MLTPVTAANGGSSVPGRLHYSSDNRPGIRRVRSGRGFRYLRPDGEPLRDGETLARIRSIVIPPAWTDVWICPSPNGHLQATGRDARGRKQYRYHPDYRAARERLKFDRVLIFGRVLPRIRQRVKRDLARRGLPREKVLATVVALLERTLVRVGNPEYARDNRSYGLTTLRDRHAQVDGSLIRFRFRGKGGRVHEVDIRDRRLARVVQGCQDLPGQDLFQYLDENGDAVDVRSDDVNAYLREAAGEEVTAKDFRTWAGTLIAYRALRGSEIPVPRGAVDRASRRAILAAVRTTAERLGNTIAVCRQSYIHPAVFAAHANGGLADVVAQVVEEGLDPIAAWTPADEREIVKLLIRAARNGSSRATASKATRRGRPSRQVQSPG
jgi:DNA topoisomerase I